MYIIIFQVRICNTRTTSYFVKIKNFYYSNTIYVPYLLLGYVVASRTTKKRLATFGRLNSFFVFCASFNKLYLYSFTAFYTREAHARNLDLFKGCTTPDLCLEM